MNNDFFEQQVLEYLKGNLSLQEVTDFESLIANDNSKQQPFNEIKTIWELTKTEKLETPDDSLREGFYNMLSMHTLEEKSKPKTFFQSVSIFFNNILQHKPAGQLAMLTVVVLISGYIGFQLNSNASGQNEIVLNQEVEKLNQEVASLQLKSASASDRIQAVNNLNSSNLKEESIIKNLINKLLYDDNMHVRMAAGKSLTLFKNHLQVKTAILKAVQLEKELLVKATLIDALIEIDREAALEEIYRIYESENTSPEMKALYKEIVETKSI